VPGFGPALPIGENSALPELIEGTFYQGATVDGVDGNVRSPQRLARRRADVLQAARRLFAAEGIDKVSTSRIAREAGISPGNLYYWFPSKAEIIRALYRQWSEESRLPVLEPEAEPGRVLQLLWTRAGTQRQASAGFGFFQRDLFTLLHGDPVLAADYRRTYEARVAEFTALVETIIDAGLVRRPEPPATARLLVEVLWLVAETASPFADLVGAATGDPARLANAVVEPWLTDAGRAVLDMPEVALA
jgi:AcrR family transcriptional regulator